MPRSAQALRLRHTLSLASIAAALAAALLAPQTATAEEAIFSSTQTIAVPPASTFKTKGGGDGWAVALSESAVYNVFHHQPKLTVACHLQSSAESCFTPETVTDGEGHDFATSGHPGMYFDKRTDKLYVYATRSIDGTAGVVCFDTALATTESDPFCGFTALTPPGQASLQSGISGVGTPMLIGKHWYAFNEVEGTNVSGAEDALLCFNVETDAACTGQPFDLPFGAGNVSGIYPGPPSAAIAGRAIIPLAVEGRTRIACFDDETQSTCAGGWPLELDSIAYAGANGSPFPLLDDSGETAGFCIPTGADQCFTLEGASTETPAGMSEVIAANDEWNGPAVAIGPRVYVPNGVPSGDSGDVECFDYSTDKGCPNFPKQFSGVHYLYTVNLDPQRPSCLWVNADSGEEQIQDFDAYTGGACGAGPVRGLGIQFVAPGPQCTPISYISLRVLEPARASYTSGTIAYANADGELISGLPESSLDATGTVSLEGLNLERMTGLPEFLFSFNGPSGEVGSLEAQLTWRGTYDPECLGEGITAATSPPTSDPSTPTSYPASSPSSPVSAPATVCTRHQMGLVNVAQERHHVRIEGVAPLRLAGKAVEIKLLATGRTVAMARVAPSGTFSTTAPLPQADIRRSNLARYEAVAGSMKTLPMKLHRRMYMTRAGFSSSSATLRGRVTGSFKPGAEVTIYVSHTCTTQQTIARTHLTSTGTFSVTVSGVAAPAGEVTLYRARTTVLYRGQSFSTYTLQAAPAVR